MVTDNFGNLVKVNNYMGKRTKRGLFRAGCGKLINSDIQGSLNMIRKVAGDAFMYHNMDRNSVEGFAVTPVRACLG